MLRNTLGRTVLPIVLIGLAATSATAELRLHYTFDSQTAADSASNPANGTLIGANATLVNTTSPGGTGYVFSSGAGDNYITTGTAGSQASIDQEPVGDTPSDKLDVLSSFTLVTWINLRQTPGSFERIMSKTAGGGGAGFEFSISSATATTANISLTVDSGTTGTVAANYTANEWIFLAVTYDGTGASSNVKFYLGDTDSAVLQIGLSQTLLQGLTGDSGATFQVAGTAATTADRSPFAYFDDVRVYGASSGSGGVLSLGDLELIRSSAVPEPASLGLLALGSLVGLGRRRRGK